MVRRFVTGLWLPLLVCVLWPAYAGAQAAGGIAGVVRDPSGAVLPGVTVEASSPALIEKVRAHWQFYRDRRPESYGDIARDLV